MTLNNPAQNQMSLEIQACSHFFVGVVAVFITLFSGSYSIVATISGSVTPTASSSGVEITLTGAASGRTTVDSSGSYSFTGLALGTYTVAPSKNGFSFSPPNQSLTVSRRQSAVANFSMASQSGGSTGSLIVDAQTWADRSTASSTTSTPAFTTSPGSGLLLAFVATDGPSEAPYK